MATFFEGEPGEKQRFEAHRAFLNRYYGISRGFYDLTRKYYLLGRDEALDELLGESWESLIEVGPGTGRNLRLLHGRRPAAAYGGIEACDEMLEHAIKRCSFARLTHGFAEDADFSAPFGRAPERILFSYCLSMVGDPERALLRAVEGVAPGGTVTVVDFADLNGMPQFLANPLRAWLRTFHVRPLPEGLLRNFSADLRFGPGRYSVRAVLRRGA